MSRIVRADRSPCSSLRQRLGVIAGVPAEPPVNVPQDLMTERQDAKADQRQQERLERPANRQVFLDAQPAMAIHVEQQVEERQQDRAPHRGLRQPVLDRPANDEMQVQHVTHRHRIGRRRHHRRQRDVEIAPDARAPQRAAQGRERAVSAAPR